MRHLLFPGSGMTEMDCGSLALRAVSVADVTNMKKELPGDCFDLVRVRHEGGEKARPMR